MKMACDMLFHGQIERCSSRLIVWQSNVYHDSNWSGQCNFRANVVNKDEEPQGFKILFEKGKKRVALPAFTACEMEWGGAFALLSRTVVPIRLLQQLLSCLPSNAELQGKEVLVAMRLSISCTPINH